MLGFDGAAVTSAAAAVAAASAAAHIFIFEGFTGRLEAYEGVDANDNSRVAAHK